MDSLSSLSAFVQAADTRSFTAAAQLLSISPSAVGKAVSRLEERLGVQLFHRSTRSIALTPEGVMFLERSRRILQEFQQAEAELAHVRGEPRGVLRISLPIVTETFTPIIDAFHRKYPEIQLDIDFSDRIVDLVEEGFDVVVRAGHVEDSRLMSRVIGEFRLILAASPGYLQSAPRLHEPDDLIRHACLLHRFATSRKIERWPLSGWTNEDEVLHSPKLVTNTIDPLFYLVEQGAGIACLPEEMMQTQLKEGTILQVLAPFTRHSGTMRLLWPASRHPSPKLRVFLDFMSENYPRPISGTS